MGKAKDIERAANAYFESCERSGAPLTLTGLAIALDMTKPELMAYAGTGKKQVARALSRVEQAYEERMIKRGNTGDVFGLKQFGWSDKREARAEDKRSAEPLAEKDISELMAECMGERF